MCQHRLNQSHSCPLVATQNPEVLLPFDEVSILGRPCLRCGLQADGGSEVSPSSLQISKLSEVGEAGEEAKLFQRPADLDAEHNKP